MPKPQSPQLAEPQPGRWKRKSTWMGIALVAMILLNVAGVAYVAGDSYTRTTPGFCASCHIMKSHVESYLTSHHMDSVHRRAGVGCKDCHSDYSVIDQAKSMAQFITGNYERIWSRRKIEDQMCLQCHIDLAYHADRTDYLTRNPHLSHWPDLRCNACHLSHDKQVDYCSRCHENGGQRMTGDEIVPRATNPWADSNKARVIVQ